MLELSQYVEKLTMIRFESVDELKHNTSPDFVAKNAEKLGIVATVEQVYGNQQVLNANSGLAKEPEKDFQKWLIGELEKAGWRVHAERAARTKDGWKTPVQGSPGYPDITAVRPPRLLFIECKSDSGQASPDQVDWLLKLGKVEGEIEVLCVSPKDRDDILEAIK